MTDAPALSLEHLTKFYGRRRGVEDLSMHVDRGEIVGFLGPNGAGKTTTMRMVLDLIRPTSGTVHVFGVSLRTRSVGALRAVGYLPGTLALYDELTGHELLRFLARLRPGSDLGYAARLAGRLDLDLSVRCRVLSKGNRQKVGLVQALMHRPALLVLDEPTSGLDPLAQREVHALVREVADDGGAVFFSSHVLSEVERIAHRVAIVSEGRLAVLDDVGKLKARAVRHLELEFASAPPAAPFAAVPGVRRVNGEGNLLRCEVVGPVGELLRRAVAFDLLNVVSWE